MPPSDPTQDPAPKGSDRSGAGKPGPSPIDPHPPSLLMHQTAQAMEMDRPKGPRRTWVVWAGLVIFLALAAFALWLLGGTGDNP